MPLRPSEELILWRQLKDICDVNQLPLFYEEDLPLVHRYLPGSYRQHSSTRRKRFLGFLADVEREILSDFKKEKERSHRKGKGEPAPFSKRHDKGMIPNGSN